MLPPPSLQERLVTLPPGTDDTVATDNVPPSFSSRAEVHLPPQPPPAPATHYRQPALPPVFPAPPATLFDDPMVEDNLELPPAHPFLPIQDEMVGDGEWQEGIQAPPQIAAPPLPPAQGTGERVQKPVPAVKLATRHSARLASARKRAVARSALPLAAQANLMQAVHSAVKQVKAAHPKPSVYEYTGAGGHQEGPAYISDDYGLPKRRPGVPQPAWMHKRRQFLKRLSSDERNYILTGDPGFAFDPQTYEVCLNYPGALPPVLQENFGYLLPPLPAPLQPVVLQHQPPPDNIVRPLAIRQQVRNFLGFRPKPNSSSSSSSGHTTAPTSPCPTRPLSPRRPGRPPTDVVGRVADSLAYLQVSPPAAAYALRSGLPGTSSGDSPVRHTPPHQTGWQRGLHRVGREALELFEASPFNDQRVVRQIQADRRLRDFERQQQGPSSKMARTPPPARK